MGWSHCRNLTRVAFVTHAFAVGVAQADVIAVWNFNDSTLNPARHATSTTPTLTSNFSDLYFDGGTTVGQHGADAEGKAAFLLRSRVDEGKSLTFSLNLTGWKDLTVSFAAWKRNLDNYSNRVEYSTGGTFAAAAMTGSTNPYNPTRNWTLYTFGFANVSALNDHPDAKVRVTFDKWFDTNRTSIDNVVFSATPLPAGTLPSGPTDDGVTAIPSPSAAGGGLALIGMAGMGRRRRSRPPAVSNHDCL